MFTLDSYSSDFLNNPEFLIKLIGTISGFVVFIIGLRRYIKGQIWKKNEFVANEFKEFNNNKMVRNTMYMLDWGTRYIELFPDKQNYKERFIKVSRITLKTALQSHKIKEKFNMDEVAIRDHFDLFLDYLEKFQHFIEAGLISESELKPYLKYWINRVSNKIEPDVRNSIYHYINEYEYTGVQKLFEKFHKNIIPTTSINSCRINEEETKQNNDFDDEFSIY